MDKPETQAGRKTDEQIVESLKLAGIPKTYRGKGVRWADGGEPGKEASRFVTGGRKGELMRGGVYIIGGHTADHITTFHLMLRALVLMNYPACEMFAEDLMPRRTTAETREKMLAYSILGLEGMTPHNCNPYKGDASTVEWLLTRWLNEEKGLVLLTDGQFSECDIWSLPFRSLVRSRLVQG